MSTTTIQVQHIERLAGRRHEHVEVRGYRVADLHRRPVVIALSVFDAGILLAYGNTSGSYPQIEVPDSAWMFLFTIPPEGD